MASISPLYSAAVRAIQLPGRSAGRIPIGMAMSTAIAIAPIARAMVAGSFCLISSATGKSLIQERPRSPRKTPSIQTRYCFQSGSSSPISARKAAICSGFAVGPSNV